MASNSRLHVFRHLCLLDGTDKNQTTENQKKIMVMPVLVTVAGMTVGIKSREGLRKAGASAKAR